ncbi:MAG: hypothetical protein ACI9GZ_003568 [Bacteroidia bacterium]
MDKARRPHKKLGYRKLISSKFIKQMSYSN